MRPRPASASEPRAAAERPRRRPRSRRSRVSRLPRPKSAPPTSPPLRPKSPPRSPEPPKTPAPARARSPRARKRNTSTIGLFFFQPRQTPYRGMARPDMESKMRRQMPGILPWIAIAAAVTIGGAVLAPALEGQGKAGLPPRLGDYTARHVKLTAAQHQQLLAGQPVTQMLDA